MSRNARNGEFGSFDEILPRSWQITVMVTNLARFRQISKWMQISLRLVTIWLRIADRNKVCDRLRSYENQPLDRTWFYLLRSSAIAIAGSQTIAEVVSIWSQTIADLIAICDLRFAIIWKPALNTRKPAMLADLTILANVTNLANFCHFRRIRHFAGTLLLWGGGGGDRGAGARENRGREGYGRRERKGREAGVLRGREAGEQYKTVNFFTY